MDLLKQSSFAYVQVSISLHFAILKNNNSRQTMWVFLRPDSLAIIDSLQQKDSIPGIYKYLYLT